MRNKLFEKICCKGQCELKEWLAKRLESMGKTVVNKDGYLFSDGEFPVLLTAHMDTVHKKQCANIKYVKSANGKTIAYESNGIGGDDRCGIYMILQILKQLDCAVLFCEDEEIGSIGASEFTRSDLCQTLKAENRFKYIIELDRMNSNDAVFYEDDNEDFHSFVTKEFWETSYGSWSDIRELSPALGISSVNLSCGYYNQHTNEEYVVLEEMEEAIKQTIALLKRTDLEAEPFEFIENRYYGYNWEYKYLNGNIYDSDTGRCYLEVWLADDTKFGSHWLSVYGNTENDCWHKIFFENPELCVNDIANWYIY